MSYRGVSILEDKEDSYRVYGFEFLTHKPFMVQIKQIPYINSWKIVNYIFENGGWSYYRAYTSDSDACIREDL